MLQAILLDWLGKSCSPPAHSSSASRTPSTLSTTALYLQYFKNPITKFHIQHEVPPPTMEVRGGGGGTRRGTGGRLPVHTRRL